MIRFSEAEGQTSVIMVFMMNQDLFRLLTVAYKAGESFRKAKQMYVEQARLHDNGYSQSSFRRYKNALEAAATYQHALYDLWSMIDSTEYFPRKEERLQHIMAQLDILFIWCDVMARQFHEWLEPIDPATAKHALARARLRREKVYEAMLLRFR